jgi:hypothetical protein
MMDEGGANKGGWVRMLCAANVVVVWCGVVWCGVVWCGVVWCGVVWCGVVWYRPAGRIWCGGHLSSGAKFASQNPRSFPRAPRQTTPAPLLPEGRKPRSCVRRTHWGGVDEWLCVNECRVCAIGRPRELGACTRCNTWNSLPARRGLACWASVCWRRGAAPQSIDVLCGVDPRSPVL